MNKNIPRKYKDLTKVLEAVFVLHNDQASVVLGFSLNKEFNIYLYGIDDSEVLKNDQGSSICKQSKSKHIGTKFCLVKVCKIFLGPIFGMS